MTFHIFMFPMPFPHTELYILNRKSPNLSNLLCTPRFVDQTTTVSYLKGLMHDLKFSGLRVNPFPEQVVGTLIVSTKFQEQTVIVTSLPSP